MAIGIMFAGLIFCLFKAIAAIDVPTAILSYFTYPLLTGLAASLAGLEPLRWKGVLCAVAAFFGLAIMIGAHPAGLAFAGVGYALGAACCRTGVLLVTRAYLVGADARLTTWYSMISSTVVFIAASLGTRTWHPPQTGLGWACLIALSLGDDRCHPVRIRLDHAHRTVPHRADHASRAADRDDPQRDPARRGDYADPRRRQRDHAGGADRISIVAMTMARRFGAIANGNATRLLPRLSA